MFTNSYIWQSHVFFISLCKYSLFESHIYSFTFVIAWVLLFCQTPFFIYANNNWNCTHNYLYTVPMPNTYIHRINSYQTLQTQFHNTSRSKFDWISSAELKCSGGNHFLFTDWWRIWSEHEIDFILHILV